jgi:hypothetical protein
MRRIETFLLLVALLAGTTSSLGRVVRDLQNSAHGTGEGKVHNKHHLEGVLLSPGTFRVYLYDEHTKPVKADQVKKASGTIQIGESEDAPKIALAPGKSEGTLEAALGANVKFPVAVTLLLHLPGMPPAAKPELFNFTFRQFTNENGHGTSAPTRNTPRVRH